MGWLWSWMATRAATGWLLALCIALVGAGWVYVSRLQVAAARCETSQEQEDRFERLADRVASQIAKDSDDVVKKIENAPPGGCLDQRVSDLMRIDPVGRR